MFPTQFFLCYMKWIVLLEYYSDKLYIAKIYILIYYIGITFIELTLLAKNQIIRG